MDDALVELIVDSDDDDDVLLCSNNSGGQDDENSEYHFIFLDEHLVLPTKKGCMEENEVARFMQHDDAPSKSNAAK